MSTRLALIPPEQLQRLRNNQRPENETYRNVAANDGIRIFGMARKPKVESTEVEIEESATAKQDNATESLIELVLLARPFLGLCTAGEGQKEQELRSPEAPGAFHIPIVSALPGPD